MTAEEIQQRMAILRRDLTDDVQEIRASSETMLNWRYYFKRYPWQMVAAAAAVGYFVVPRRIEIVRPDPKTLAKLAKQEQLVVKPKAETKPDKGLAGIALGLVGNALLRAGSAYVGQQASRMFSHQAEDGNGHLRRSNV